VITAAAATDSKLERELRHLHDLVFVRDVLRARGASTDELEQCETVIMDARERVARMARRRAEPYRAAA
jgi:hypothetical protein